MIDEIKKLRDYLRKKQDNLAKLAFDEDEEEWLDEEVRGEYNACEFVATKLSSIIDKYEGMQRHE